MSSAFPREQKKQEMNSGPWSEVTCLKTPCLENTWRMNKTARSLEVQWIVVRIKIPCFVSQSTITRITSQLEEVRRVSMKSVEIEFHGWMGRGVALAGHKACDTEA